MKIKGKVHCFFEQSGVFKNEFKKLGYEAYDYDIQNNFGETDHVVDLFKAIEDAYDGKPSLFDSIVGGEEDLILAFFPCIYFCQASQSAFTYTYNNYQKYSIRQKTDAILKRSQDREYFYTLIIKLFGLVQERNIRMIVENPYSGQHYLALAQNFVMPATFIDHNRQLRGDYFKKPTQYWFVNCTPTHGFTEQKDKEMKTIMKAKGASKAGLCSEDRSMISPDYARNFIYDFILGKEQLGSQMSLFG